MRRYAKRFSLAMVTGAVAALTVVQVAAAGVVATVDANLTSSLDQVTSYFTDNIGVVIAAFIGIAAFLWLLGMALRSVGVTKKSKVG